MATRIYKYQLELIDWQSVDMPVGAEILHVAMQGDYPCIWARVRPDDGELVTHSIRMVGTGMRLETHALDDMTYTHIGTVLMAGGSLVFHFFDVSKEADHG